MLLRLSLAAIAVLAAAWLGVLLRDHNLGQAASLRVLYGPKLNQAEFTREMQHLEDAEFLNPESRWQLDRGKAWLPRSRPRRAARAMDAFVRREPDNLDAWLVLLIARGIYKGPTAQPLSEIRRLDPLGARRQRPRAPGAAR